MLDSSNYGVIFLLLMAMLLLHMPDIFFSLNQVAKFHMTATFCQTLNRKVFDNGCLLNVSYSLMFAVVARNIKARQRYPNS